jgi:pimeloyl-ACP methyl ester carboxylesterase
MTTIKHIIALHGAGMKASVWETLAVNLSSSCVALALPQPPLSSIESMAAWLVTQLNKHAQGSVILMGHSMGALMVLETAQNSAVAGVILIGAAAQMPVHPDLLKQAQATPDVAAGLILKWGVSSAQPPEVQQAVRQHMQPATLFNDLSACNAYQHGKPALVLSGADDKLTKADAGKALAGLMPHGRFHQVTGSGHMLMIENPVEIAKEINSFGAALQN